MVSNALSSRGLDPGYCSIEQFNAKKDPFRVAPTNKLPIPWPHDNKRIPLTPRDGEFIDAIEDIVLGGLKKFGVGHRTTHDQKRTQWGFPRPIEDTFIILSRDTDTTRWQEAVDYIYMMANEFTARSGTTVGVELENPYKRYSDISKAIEPGTAIHRSFLSIEPVVEAEVRKSCSNLWTSIAYHNRQNKFSTTRDFPGYPSVDPPNSYDSTKRPTVIVFVTPGSMAYWGKIQAQIRQAIEAVPFEEVVQIALEILPGFNEPSTVPYTAGPVTTSHHPKYQRDISPIPTLGVSIGPQLSDTDSGTLGAVLNFQPHGGGQAQKCFLTAYHAIASGDPIGRSVNDKFGIGLDGRAVTRQIEISYPACCDGEDSKESLAKYAAGNTSPDRHLAALKALIEREGVIGEVIHASGLRYSGSGDRPHRMDWALVALHPSKDSVLNSLPERSKFPYWCASVELDFHYYAKLGDVISQIGIPAAFSWAGKFDRPPWATAGRVNSMKRTVCWGDGVVSKEVEVLPFGTQFAEGGDDGSMVFNLKKEWVGMVVGGDSEYAGYITPAADIIADIEERTGGTITLI
ncbi:hypothetical protein V490_06778 [Pseudogymnoascus sp. VKM F-3557]|nr:hypothetical protein V490_06778 [Pseudogymnoascus sp. VKM F-3557]